jgi:hypothetical protein
MNNAPSKVLLAVDVGLRSGLALFDDSGKLLWYRSHNFGSVPRLRKAAGRMLGDMPHCAWLVLEGGGTIAAVWEREAKRRGIEILKVEAVDWRSRFLYPREQRTGLGAKHSADPLARRVIRWSQAPKPTSLRHDASEAIMTGLWGVIAVGWLTEVPPEVRNR